MLASTLKVGCSPRHALCVVLKLSAGESENSEIWGARADLEEPRPLEGSREDNVAESEHRRLRLEEWLRAVR